MQNHLVIAIDGPAGAGKSTAARQLAELLHIHILDTGALFRAYAWYAYKAGVELSDTGAVNALLKDVKLDISMMGNQQRTLVNGEDVSDIIRTPLVSQGASALGSNSFVRQVLTAQVRRIAKATSLVVDGRDIGTAMLPDATVKFFLTASPQERARRRYLEQQCSGMTESYGDVLEKIIARDDADATRNIAPLKCADDAVVIDSTDMNVKQVLDLMLHVIEGKTR